MRAVLNWIDHRTGLSAALRPWLDRPVPGGPGWPKIWPCTIAFTFCVQAITGLFLWMYYSPSAQTAWESVYFLQHEVVGGWLLRAVHHYSAQVMLVLIGLYLLQTIVAGKYRAPRELVFWTIVLMGLVTLGLLLTGDLLAWDQNSYASTQVRVNFLNLLPGIGGGLFKLAAGGPAFGHLTLTRFFALHVGLLAAAVLALLILHAALVRRADAAGPGPAENARPFWPYQALRNTIACVVVLEVVFLLATQHGLSGDQAGVPLGSPADPASTYTAARPEWAFLGLYQFSNLFPGEVKIIPIFIVTGLLALVVFAMPWIARVKRGHQLNLALTAVLLVGIVVLSLVVVWKDRHNPSHQAALAAQRQLADRTRQLARAQGIPGTGALTLLRNDPQTQGPVLCEQHCVSCHGYSAAEAGALVAENPSAPELHRFAGRPWLAGLLDPEQIKGPKYFGNTRFAAGVMVKYVEGRFAKLKKPDRDKIIAALSAEARLRSQQKVDDKDQELIREGNQRIVEHCTPCHRYHGQGTSGAAPDLTGYGSRQWIVGILADATHAWFYGRRNDRMPVYLEFPEQPADNLLAARDVGILADWLRGEWYQPGQAEPEAGRPAANSVAVLLDRWQSRRPKQAAAVETGPHAEARRLFQLELCSLCHDYTAAVGDDVRAPQPAAPDLGGFASREWIAGLLDPKQIKTPKYFGSTALRNGEMAGFVLDMFSDLDDEDKADLQKVIIALSAEAQLPSQRELDEKDADRIAEGRKMLVDDFGCADCHRFHGQGTSNGPDLTGYGSREWLVEIISDPADNRFYGKKNDGMASYLAFPDHPGRNLLTVGQIDSLADFLRNEPEPD